MLGGFNGTQTETLEELKMLMRLRQQQDRVLFQVISLDTKEF